MFDIIFTAIYILFICLIVYQSYKIATIYPQIKAIDKKNQVKKKKRRRATTPRENLNLLSIQNKVSIY